MCFFLRLGQRVSRDMAAVFTGQGTKLTEIVSQPSGRNTPTRLPQGYKATE